MRIEDHDAVGQRAKPAGQRRDGRDAEPPLGFTFPVVDEDARRRFGVRLLRCQRVHDEPVAERRLATAWPAKDERDVGRERVIEKIHNQKLKAEILKR